MPSLNELMEGLVALHLRQIEEWMMGLSENALMRFVNSINQTYTEIFTSIGILDWKKPFKDSEDADIGVSNPYSRISCFVVKLYSMEIGIPPLYSEVNRVTREMDLTILKEIGPFVRLLSKIT